MFGKDFDTYVSEITSFIQLRFGPAVANNIVGSSQGIMLIEMVAFALSTMAWFGDRQADDTTLRDVRIRAAGVAIARQLGYKPNAAVPAVVEITITLDTAPPTRLTIEKGRQLNGPGGLKFETTADLVFDPGDVGPKVFSAKQGETLTGTFTSDGLAAQVFPITSVPDDSKIAQDSPFATIAGAEWVEQTFLTFVQTNQFEFQYGFAPPRLIFGDGNAGNIPPKDAEIRLKFFVTKGTDGSVAANTVTAFTTPLAVSGTTITAVLVHDDPSTPGSNREALDSIKVNAPLVFQGADRAVTQDDLDGIINSFIDPVFGSVAIGRATVPRSAAASAEAQTILLLVQGLGASQDILDGIEAFFDKILSSNCQSNLVNAQILAEDSVGRYIQAPVGLARALETHLDARAESTVAVHVTDGTINLLSVDLSVAIKVTDEFSDDESADGVRDSVRTTLEDVLLGRGYGESLRISDLYVLVDALPGVDYSHIAVIGDATALARVNSFGDLPIESFEVITLGVSPTPTLI